MNKKEAEEKLELITKDLAGKRVHLKSSLNPRGEIIYKLFIKQISLEDDSWQIFVEFFIRDFKPQFLGNKGAFNATDPISLDELVRNYDIVN